MIESVDASHTEMEAEEDEEEDVDTDALVMQLAQQIQHLQQENSKMHRQVKKMQVVINNQSVSEKSMNFSISNRSF